MNEPPPRPVPENPADTAAGPSPPRSASAISGQPSAGQMQAGPVPAGKPWDGQAQAGQAQAGQPSAAPAPVASAPPAPANQSRALAETVVTSIVDRLTAEAQRRGGYLSVADIGALSQEFRHKAESLQAVFEKSFEDYVRVRERAVWDQKREFPFDRQIVKKFTHLFPSPGGLSLEDGAVSRRILPGFFLGMNLMLGEEKIEEYQDACRAVVDRLKAARGQKFSWKDVQGDKQIDDITVDAVVAISLHFAALDKRAEWFVELINAHLAPPDAGREGEAAINWQMTAEVFWTFLHALFSDARRLMSTEPGRLQLTKRYGAETCAYLAEILKFLEEEVAE
jgi:hypothetical protein